MAVSYDRKDAGSTECATQDDIRSSIPRWVLRGILAASRMSEYTLKPVTISDADIIEIAGLLRTVFPDADALAAFGDDMMSPASRPPAARAGFAQGAALAASLRGWWA